jgi:SAM-dependent methyltransferase
VLPARGLVLEIGSGTGQHVVHFAKALPDLVFQPADVDAGYRESIRRWIAAEALANVRPPLALDVHERPWPIEAADAIVCINVLHVAPWSAALALLDGARDVVAPGGILYLDGPYKRGGQHTAASNEQFDASLRAHDPQWGVRDVDDLTRAAAVAGFSRSAIVEMPANNLSLVFARHTERR